MIIKEKLQEYIYMRAYGIYKEKKEKYIPVPKYSYIQQNLKMTKLISRPQ